MSGSVTQKYCPALKSTSMPSRSKVTISVCLATSSFSLITDRMSGDRGDEDEDDGDHSEQSVEPNDRDWEALLRRRAHRRRRACGGHSLPALVPDREHREAEGRDQREDDEGDPGERVAVGRDIDDPEHEPGRRQREVAEDEVRLDLSRRTLAHASVAKPDRQEEEPSARRQDPADECCPLHSGVPPFLTRLARFRMPEDTRCRHGERLLKWQLSNAWTATPRSPTMPSSRRRGATSRERTCSRRPSRRPTARFGSRTRWRC